MDFGDSERLMTFQGLLFLRVSKISVFCLPSELVQTSESMCFVCPLKRSRVRIRHIMRYAICFRPWGAPGDSADLLSSLRFGSQMPLLESSVYNLAYDPLADPKSAFTYAVGCSMSSKNSKP